ncbi:MAG: hypothetical protein J6112_00915 [Clostridia bacterium]|nr:hypothetical protein [Clostridia bacterium]
MKSDKKAPFEPVLNWSTGEIEYEFKDGIILGNKGKTKVKVTDDVAVDIGSGGAELVRPLFGRKRKKS